MNEGNAAGRTAAPCRSRPLRTAFVVGALLPVLLWSHPSLAQDDVDPLEPLNRAVFRFNEVADGLVLEPMAHLYGLVVPGPARRGLRNFLANLKAPVVFANDVLQGERERAGVTFSRFFVNTVLGGFGIFDVASALGFEPHVEDFGQTMAVWGVGEGVYIVLPLLGPSNARDAAGFVVDFFLFDPMAYAAPAEVRAARTGAAAVDTRYVLIPAIEDLRASFDPYATARSVYRQRRAAEVRNGAPLTGTEAYEDIFREGLDGDDDGD